MKISYEELHKVRTIPEYSCNGMRLTKKGYYFIKKYHMYIYRECCKNCSDSYLTRKDRPSDFCCISCAQKNKSSISNKTRKKLSIAKKGKYIGKDAPQWKGGVRELNIPLYNTYAHQISYAEKVRSVYKDDLKVLQVKCAYCGKWFIPKTSDVHNRKNVLEGKAIGECRFYCSENCKRACPIYWKKEWPKGFKHASSREVDPNLRQMVLGRDNWTCQICGKTVEEVQLHCHHMDPATQNPMFQNDMDSCITLCKDCHDWVHTQYGCRYVDLRCDIKKEEIIKND